MTDAEARDAGYDDLLDALEAGTGYYLECANGHGALPPRRVCPHCGDAELEERGLAPSGEVLSFTVARVATPRFADDVPYVTAVVDLDAVRLTGIVETDDPDAVAVGDEVVPTVGTSATAGERYVAFEPV